MIFECWAIHIGDLQLLCKTACSFHVNNTNKGNSAVLNGSPHGCSLSPPLRSSSPRFIHSDKKLVMRHISGLQPVQLCKYHSALWGPIRLFRDSPWLCSCYIQPPHLVRTFDLINHYGFHKLRVKSASSYSLYFELNPRVYIQLLRLITACSFLKCLKYSQERPRAAHYPQIMVHVTFLVSVWVSLQTQRRWEWE